MRIVSELLRHLRASWRLFWDARVRWWQRAVFLLPVLYFLIPFRYDFLFDLAPLVGLVDDWLFALLCSYLFVAICPKPIVQRTRDVVLLSDLDPRVRDEARSRLSTSGPLTASELLEAHRHPRESLALATVLAVLLLASLLGGAVAGVTILAACGVSYLVSHLFRWRVTHRAQRVSEEQYPRVVQAISRCQGNLPQVRVEAYVIPARAPNAFTLGLDEPYVMVLTTSLIELLDQDELDAAVAHELGHVLFEHTFLSSVLGGMLYRVGLVGALWAWVFSRWRRFAELTADRVALLTIRDLDVCVSMLFKVHGASPAERITAAWILEQLPGHEQSTSAPEDALRLHPSLAKRIEALSAFDAELFALQVEDWLTERTAE